MQLKNNKNHLNNLVANMLRKLNDKANTKASKNRQLKLDEKAIINRNVIIINNSVFQKLPHKVK